MIEQFFNFKHMPFERDIPTEHLYKTPQLDELLSRLDYAARNRKFSIIIGGVGVGKTTIVRCFVDSLDKKNFRCIYIADSALTPRVFYWEVLTQLDLNVKPSFYRSDGKRKMIDRFSQLAEDSHVIPIIIIDEAHLLSACMLEETRFLLNSSMDSTNSMSLIVVGQSELRTKLSKETFEPITQRIDFRFLLTPFDRAQTQDYIQAHLRYVGEMRDIFTSSAIDSVFNFSGGIARLINKVCSLSLLYASQKAIRSIDGGMIDYVAEQELSW